MNKNVLKKFRDTPVTMRVTDSNQQPIPGAIVWTLPVIQYYLNAERTILAPNQLVCDVNGEIKVFV